MVPIPDTHTKINIISYIITLRLDRLDDYICFLFHQVFWSDVTEEAIFSAHIDEGQVFAYIALYSITIIFVHNLSRILEIDPSPSCSPTLLQTFYLLKQQTALANYEQFEYEFVLIFSTELWWRLMESSQQMGLQSTGYFIII